MNRSPDEAERNPGAEAGAVAVAEPAPSASLRPGYVLRPYNTRDEDAAVALWQRTWQAAYPELNFAERLDWWRQRWRKDLVSTTKVVVAEIDGLMAGFVTVDPRTCYLDQIVVAPEHWRGGIGAALLTEAKRLSVAGLDLDVNTDNARAIAFYVKQGFAVGGTGVNAISGKPIQRMSWRP
jgi:putative acetyltransferase